MGHKVIPSPGPFPKTRYKKILNWLNWTTNCRAWETLPWALLPPDTRSNLLLTPRRGPRHHWGRLIHFLRPRHLLENRTHFSYSCILQLRWNFSEIASLGRQASPFQVYKSNVICTLGLWKKYYFLLFQLMSAVTADRKRGKREEIESISISEPFWFNLSLHFYWRKQY